MPAREVPVTGSVLGWARDEAGLTLVDVAATLGVEPETVRAWEAGNARPTLGKF